MTMAGLRIGVNALYLLPREVGGTEIYLRAIVAALAQMDPVNSYYLFTNRETGAALAPAAPNFESVICSVRATSRPARLLWEQTGLPLRVKRLGIDVLLNAGFTAPLICPCPQVTIFHDLQHKRYPENFRWFDLPFWKFFLYWSARASTLVVASSEATRDDLRRYYHLPEGKLRLALLGVDAACFELARQRRPEPFLLTVSTLHPHKNLDGLLRAFAIFRAERPDFRLVVSGLHGFAAPELFALRDELGLAAAVEFPGWIPRESLYDLYRRAWAFLYPSKFEGFGLPVLEALAAGVPSGCSAIEPLASLAGDAALQFDPLDPDALLEAMRALVSDDGLRSRLAQAGPIRASQFSWASTARVTLAALLEASEMG